MRIDILTLFPDMFAPLRESIVKRAAESGVIDMKMTNIRDYAEDKHNTSDDRLYGGGAGMVMKPEPVYAAVNDVKSVSAPRIIFTSPRGRVFDQSMAEVLAGEEQIIIVCGHYEGIDERAIELLATDIISVGDFVLTGGELPAMIIADAVIRLLPGALGDDSSSEDESFSHGLLEYPQYTRPPEFMGKAVPEVLLSGDHAKIARWRRDMSLKITAENRPDMLKKAALDDVDLAVLESAVKKPQPFNLYVALVHFPVYDKKHRVINTSLTNLDLHDIARAARTFGLNGYYIVQPAAGQQKLMDELLQYWSRGAGASYNPDRASALEIVSIVPSIEYAVAAINAERGQSPKIIATSARTVNETVGYEDMRGIMEQDGGDYLLLLGTGWGLTDEVMELADYHLRPIYGSGNYNHLSVRSAASIIFDRLLGNI